MISADKADASSKKSNEKYSKVKFAPREVSSWNAIEPSERTWLGVPALPGINRIGMGLAQH